MPLGQNYGGLLQSYALQYALKRMGHNVIYLQREMRTGPLKEITQAFKHVVKYFLRIPSGYIFNKTYQAEALFELNTFKNKITPKTNPLQNSKELHDEIESLNLDAIIVGSDQVWRPKYVDNIFDYYLDFCKDKVELVRLSYAASFGTNEWEYDDKQTIKCSKLIKNFNAISVRESSAIALCESHYSVNAVLVLDPTFLISVEHYNRLIESANTHEIPGNLFCYILDDSTFNEEIIQTVVSISNLNIFRVSSDNKRTKLFFNKGNRVPSVEQWLRSIRDAQFVVTDSFHGCVFSIIFKKPFIATGNSIRGNSRIESLLSLLRLEDRMVFSSSDAIKVYKSDIDWKHVDNMLNRMNMQSIDFLRNNLPI